MLVNTCKRAGAFPFRALPIVAAILVCLPFGAARAEQPLRLQDALSRALAADFGVSATRARIKGAEAKIRQADQLPNPSIGFEVENFAGSGSYRAFKSPETTFYLQQTIELGNKRDARTGVARSELGKIRTRGAARVLDLFRQVEAAWIEVLSTTAQIRVAEDRLAIALQLQAEIGRRTQAGRDPQFTEARAGAQVALEKIAVDQAKATVRIARANIAGYWRGTPDFEVDLQDFESTIQAHNGNTLNVDIAVLEAERELAKARVGLERARAIPDPTVRVGVRHFNDTRDSAFIAGISIPLPLFDTNQDNIESAQSEQRAAELDIAAGRKTLRREIIRLKARIDANAAEARRIETEVIPEAERAVRLLREGLSRGGFSYVEFTDAQRTLNDARVRRIEALKAFHLDKAMVARLTGRHARMTKYKGSRR